jgi:mannose-6-phosphate isomerase-like protein (cupin superfamily)
MELKLVSEDNRRKLSEFGNGGTWKVCKVLEIKEESWIGNHYHKKKDEMFLLMDGCGTFVIGESTEVRFAPYSVLVSAGTYHAFKLERGSVLICLASEEHDPKDDYKL